MTTSFLTLIPAILQLYMMIRRTSSRLALAYSHEFGHVLDNERLIIMYSCSIAGISVKNDVVINL